MKTYTIEQVNELLDIERRATAAAQEHADKASRWEAEANRLGKRVDRLEAALKSLATVPAVIRALGNTHTIGCRCPLCVARSLVL